jgi:hypothetical protein
MKGFVANILPFLYSNILKRLWHIIVVTTVIASASDYDNARRKN